MTGPRLLGVTEHWFYDCWKCFGQLRDEGKVQFPRFVVCFTCGNKRCPKASDHDLPCSGSNEPGQPGCVHV